jgi:predicted nucleic acid-binding protein
MARYVVDARALLHIASTGVRIHPDHQLVAPNSVRSEAPSLLYDQVRRGELTEDEALRLHERLTEVKMRLLGDRVSRRTDWRIARDHGWDVIGDAEYIAVTLLRRTPSLPWTSRWRARRTASLPSRRRML